MDSNGVQAASANGGAHRQRVPNADLWWFRTLAQDLGYQKKMTAASEASVRVVFGFVSHDVAEKLLWRGVRLLVVRLCQRRLRWLSRVKGRESMQWALGTQYWTE